MKIESFSADGRREVSILAGMVMDDVVLGRISSHWGDSSLFFSQESSKIGEWCVRFYKKNNKAPGKAVELMFREWADQNQHDEDSIQNMERILRNASREGKKGINSAYIIDLAGKHFNRVRLTRLKDTIETTLEANDVERAERETKNWNPINLGQGHGIDLFNDKEAVLSYFQNDTEVLINYPGAAGALLQDMLARDSFVALEGPEKVGKTRWLVDLAWRGLLNRKRVAFFEVGDMSEKQIGIRLLVRASGQPYRSPSGWPLTLKYPTAIKHVSSTEEEEIKGFVPATVTYEDRLFKHPLDGKQAALICEKVMRKKVKSKQSYFKLYCCPTRSINVDGIRTIIQEWERDGWTPDIIVIDYADILAPPPGRYDARDQINITWEQLRGLSLSYHCLVVTASQTDTDSYDRVWLSRKNFSGDKRKNAHVTGMIGLNVTSVEKDLGITRLNVIEAREMEFNPRRGVHAAGCAALGNPIIRSCWSKGF